jgi:protein-S-isoprenylcysteine O-methyltransferase Ste14
MVIVRLTRGEEKEMVSRFRTPSRDYIQQVPMFFPRWTAIKALQQANQSPAKQ